MLSLNSEGQELIIMDNIQIRKLKVSEIKWLNKVSQATKKKKNKNQLIEEMMNLHGVEVHKGSKMVLQVRD